MLKVSAGMVFGRLTVTSFEGFHVFPKGSSERLWKCRCDCGAEITSLQGALTKGRTVSCGCYHREELVKRLTKHGMARSSTRSSWKHLVSRCLNPKDISYHSYGAKGITVCEPWLKFGNFLADMGPKPPGHSIDRIDNLKGYFKDNCRWSTREEQDRNISRAIWLVGKGRKENLSFWRKLLGVSGPVVKRLASEHGLDVVLDAKSSGKLKKIPSGKTGRTSWSVIP